MKTEITEQHDSVDIITFLNTPRNSLKELKSFFNRGCYVDIPSICNSLKNIYCTCSVNCCEKQCCHLYSVLRDAKMSCFYNLPIKTSKKAGRPIKNTNKATSEYFKKRQTIN
ncbi:hypothetical protein M153_25190001243 [Pseudoloma neurophilia]|uniref:Uncharacterized protein n=1 Tax=Pseudoloma neurophilia TaxID=146866 RepID=A0A0R0LTW1_9MICR|nr:hypothetical protein M153_25190001243 [Pseudoloma neurophilia]